MPPPLVLLPGFDGTGELFAPLVDALGASREITVVRYAREPSLQACVDTARSFLSNKPSVLVAESFSGPIALHVMNRFPERVQCAVLCATFATSPFRALIPAALALPAFALTANALGAAVLRVMCLNEARDPSPIEAVSRVSGAMTPETIKARLRVLRSLDLTPDLGNITAPTLYLRASRDRIVGRRLGQRLINGLKSVEVKEIDGPHLLLQARPRECAAAIREFVDACVSEM
jgi:pimeloyl-[acyl-carrier protein] methyl ester esterase